MTRKPLWPTETVHEAPEINPRDPWNSFETPERIAMMPPKLARVARNLGVVVTELQSVLTLYEIVTALNDKAFLGKILNSGCYPTTINIIVSTSRNMCIALVGIFDTDQNAVDLKRIVNAMLIESEKKLILDFHGQTSTEARADAQRMVEKMSFLRRRMNKGRFSKSLTNISNLRHKRFAHYDYENGQNLAAFPKRDIEFCFVNAARLADLACRVLIQRAYMLPEMRRYARNDAIAFRDALVRGAQT